MTRLVLGIGLSSKATRLEVHELVDTVAAHAAVCLDAIGLVATRMRFVDDDRVRFGPPILGVDDSDLLAQYPAPPRPVGGFAARVAEGCALTGAGPGAELLVATTRSAHATAALAHGSPGGDHA
ncbi:MAG TPA: cobalamin biosynthesis protein [Acidimicrobiales bacterium]|nr:cobalamin biosynthesis protein [Acidimicrobiales bacterium]